MSFDKLTLNFFLYPGGHHEAGWRYSQAERERLFPPPQGFLRHPRRPI